MWRSVFLHEFLGLDIRNYQAVPGVFAASPSLPAPRLEAPGPAVRVRPGESLRFRPAAAWNDLVGLSARVRIRVPTQAIAIPFPIIRIGDALEMTLRFDQPIEAIDTASGVAARGHVRLQVGATAVDVAGLQIPHRTFMDLRVDWHTSGAVGLSRDGQLQAYRNGIAAGARLALGEIVVGAVPPIGFLVNPFYDVARVFVRAMRRPDSLVGAVRLLGEVAVPADERLERCIVLRSRQLLTLCDRIRALAAIVLQQTTASGEAASGTIASSISASAARARQLAIQVLMRYARMASARDYSEADALLTDFAELLELLHDAAPAEFEALVTEHLTGMEEEPDCDGLGAAILAENQAALAPLVNLLEQMTERLRAVAGVP